VEGVSEGLVKLGNGRVINTSLKPPLYRRPYPKRQLKAVNFCRGKWHSAE